MRKEIKHPVRFVLALTFLSMTAVLYQNCAKGFEAQQMTDLASGGGSLLNQDSKGNPFVCADVSQQGKSPLRRLTKPQYSNTVLSALGSSLHEQLKPSIETLYSDQLMKNVRDFQPTIDDTQMNAYQSVAEKAYLTIQGTPATATQLATSCISTTPVTLTCKSNFIKNIGKKMFRRPLSNEEVTKFVSRAFDQGADGVEGVALTIYAFLMSPDFHLRLELGNASDTSVASIYNLSPYEVASRISYFLMDAPPDAQLMDAADKGQLSTMAEVSVHVDRLIADPKAQAKIKDFFRFWLDPKKYSQMSFSPEFLNGLDVPGVNAEMEREMFEYIDYVVFQKKGSFKDLLAGTESFARYAPAAQIYGHAPASGNTPAQMAPVRKGLLMRLPVIATEGNETHPILRGVKFRQRFLCDQLGLPSGVMTSDPRFFSDEARLTATTRTRTAGLTSSASCMACHSSINPIGFAFESFDGMGRHRTIEKSYSVLGKQLAEFPVDTRVNDFYIHPGATVGVNDATEVIDQMLASNKAPACFVQQIYRYYQVKQENNLDGCQLASMYEKLKGQDYEGKPILSVFKEFFVYPTIFKRSM